MNFIEDAILAHVPEPTTFAFDEVDRILGRPYQCDFFAMLRMWHNNRAQPLSVWESVDLALVIATEPYLLIDAAPAVRLLVLAHPIHRWRSGQA